MSGRPDGDAFVLAVDLGGTKAALAAATPDGEFLARATLDTRPADGAEKLLARVVEGGLALAAGVPGRLAAVGAVSPGVVLEDRVLMAPNVPGLERTALASELRRGFGVDAVGVGNDVKAGALAEAERGALRGSRSGIFLNLGTGLAVALVSDGRVLGGAHGAAGELGYQLRGVDELPRATSGAESAPLEEYVSGRALAERGSALLGREASTAEVFAAAGSGEHPDVARLVDDAVDTLAVHVANLAVVVDPDRVVACGGMLRGPAGPRILDRVRDVLGRVAAFPVDVTPGSFPQDAPLRGAALLGARAL